MSDPCNDLKSIKERYELLQSLCRQQIMLNETLKSELMRLGALYQRVSAERSLLLSELVNNHLSCSNASNNVTLPDCSAQCSPPSQDSQKRSTYSRGHSPNPSKKSKLSDEKPRLSRVLDSKAAASLEDVPLDCDSDLSVSKTTASHAAVERPMTSFTSGVMARTQMSRLQSMATQLNSSSVCSTVVDLNSHTSRDSYEGSRSDSPPSITVGSASNLAVSQLPQRSSKPHSLLSNSSTNDSMPFVPFTANRRTSTGMQVTKSNLTPPGRVGTSAGLVNRSSVSVNVIRSSNNTSSRATHQLPQVRSPQGSTLRPPGSAGGPRILIQPSSTSVRPVLIQATETILSGLSEEHQ